MAVVKIVNNGFDDIQSLLLLDIDALEALEIPNPDVTLMKIQNALNTLTTDEIEAE